MKGDILAGGGHTATFPAAPKITQEAWDKIWEEEVTDVESAEKTLDMLRKSLPKLKK